MNIIDTIQLMFPGYLFWWLIGILVMLGFIHAQTYHRRIYVIPGILLSACVGLLMWVGVDNYLNTVSLSTTTTFLIRGTPIIFALCVATMATSPAWLNLTSSNESKQEVRTP